MVEVRGMPILWHIMKTYAYYGFNEFILCLGYKGDVIKKIFTIMRFYPMTLPLSSDLKM